MWVLEVLNATELLITSGLFDEPEKPWLYREISSSNSGLQSFYLPLLFLPLYFFPLTPQILFPNETLLLLLCFIPYYTVFKKQ